jgi:hypothetical protein
MSHPMTPFVHRPLPDKRIASICTTCYVTVAKKSKADELEELEKKHDCDVMVDYQMMD